MGKTHKDLLAMKAHYFFFFAALGPILPQLNVFGRQLGISPDVMGLVTSVLPIFWALSKPGFGFAVDYFYKQRKLLFVSLILIMSGSYCLLYFLPDTPRTTPSVIIDIKADWIKQSSHPWVYISPLPEFHPDNFPHDLEISSVSCGWTCVDEIRALDVPNSNLNHTIPSHWNLYMNAITPNDSYSFVNFYDTNLHNVTDCGYFYMDEYSGPSNGTSEKYVDKNFDDSLGISCVFKNNCLIFSCVLLGNMNLSDFNYSSTYNSLSGTAHEQEYYLYGTVTFWGFVILMCVGTVAFNVANCISDAICFDVLGPERNMKYGYQRAWGTVGYGITALVAGWAIDLASTDSSMKDFTPAFVLIILFTAIDIYVCRKLELPKMSRPKGAGSTLSVLLSQPSVVVFLFFAVMAGVFDSFIIYYMFWFLEELATQTGHMSNIKLLEGLTVAVESFGGELLFFLISGKILKRCGFGNTLTFCLACYGIRFIAISLITNPWQILAIELIMQGPTYALTYSTIVGYAAAMAPPGLSATLQGIVAGMDDGFGFALGSLLGGQLYTHLGGRNAFQFFSFVAFVAAIVHAILVATVFKNYIKKSDGLSSSNNAENTPEVDKLLEKTLAGKIVSFSELERNEEEIKQNNNSSPLPSGVKP